MAIAEAETVEGQLGGDTLDAIAELSAWLPRP